nr:ribonuclease H-like domain-containing protein [Tanacetum cinerariifolium]
ETCRRSHTDEVLGRKWDRVNAILLGWILNSISEELYLGQIFSKMASCVWEELIESYDKVDGKNTYSRCWDGSKSILSKSNNIHVVLGDNTEKTKHSEVKDQDCDKFRREIKEVSPTSSIGNGGARSKKKRKADGVMDVECIEVVLDFNQGTTNDENLVVKIDCNEGEVGTRKCIVNMEQVKEIREMVGVSWVLAEEEKKEGDQIRRGSGAEGNVVEEAWKKEARSYRPDCIFRDRLKNVKASLRGWSKERFGGNKDKIKSLRSEAMRWELEAKKRTLNDNERIKWDAEGDENSKFFHSFLKRRNNKCSLRGLIVDGVWSEDPKKISKEDARMLEKPFEEKDVWDAICGCGGDKYPRPNEMGVRQCDPLSPFLFLLASETLNVIVNEAVEKGIFRGVTVGANNVIVSHLQYADDTIFFEE